MNTRYLTLILLFTTSCLLFNCARSQLESKTNLFRITKSPLKTSSLASLDDLGGAHLLNALNANIDRLQNYYKPHQLIEFGKYKVEARQYIESLKALAEQIQSSRDDTEWLKFIHDHFVFLEVYGQKKWGQVFMTSYYEPIIKGSRKETKTYTQALYQTPEELLSIDLSLFAEISPSLEALNKVGEQKTDFPLLRGRIEDKKVVPFFDRKQIDENNRLAQKGYELAWVRPIDAFFLQIQGSGRVILEDGKVLRLGYSAQNGHEYVAIGKFLLDRIPLEKMSLQSIEAEMSMMSADEQQELMNKNPSYVFFEVLDSKAIGSFGAEVVPGRTIATDRRLFPKGALAFLDFEVPRFDTAQALEPSTWVPAQRFVLDQDTGGAIKGPGRIDLFWGAGDEAKQAAGVYRRTADLYYLFPKSVIKSSTP